jgi:hypothetical protein
MPSRNGLDASHGNAQAKSSHCRVLASLNAGISTRGLEIAGHSTLYRTRMMTAHDDIHIRFFSWKGPESISVMTILRLAKRKFRTMDQGLSI